MRLSTFQDFMKWIKANDHETEEKKPSKVETDFKEKVKKIVEDK